MSSHSEIFRRCTASMRFIAVTVSALALLLGSADAQQAESLADVLSDSQWRSLERSVDRGLKWLSTQQEKDGSFDSAKVGQPAVTSLAIMAFLSRGHQPGSGPYGKQLEAAIDYVLNAQRGDGLFSVLDARGEYKKHQASHTASYNHAVTGLMLGEVYGMCSGKQSERVRQAIEKALIYTWKLQRNHKDRDSDLGGWRYVADRNDRDSDIGVTGWHLMFLRSARNAEFDVPKMFIDDALGFVRRCRVDTRKGVFSYYPDDEDEASMTMTAIGTLSLALGGQFKDPLVKEAADWMLDKGVDDYDDNKRWHYCHYYYVQAMAQVGGEYWRETFPKALSELVRNQRKDGKWEPSNGPKEEVFGPSYFTALGILTLTPPYQLLPLYQR
ncbi:MAG: terpene cyclase/mutase family protein [Verrucomicrobiae bacterium]|nr:terpene cyclase/mutase family protein [Verrucomicrobiae bacterium]